MTILISRTFSSSFEKVILFAFFIPRKSGIVKTGIVVSDRYQKTNLPKLPHHPLRKQPRLLDHPGLPFPVRVRDRRAAEDVDMV